MTNIMNIRSHRLHNLVLYVVIQAGGKGANMFASCVSHAVQRIPVQHFPYGVGRSVHLEGDFASIVATPTEQGGRKTESSVSICTMKFSFQSKDNSITDR